MIAAMGFKWPSKRILIGKTDLDSAYQRSHANVQIASTCIAIVGKLAFRCITLHFGNIPVPEEYTIISDSDIDLGGDLISDASYTPSP